MGKSQVCEVQAETPDRRPPTGLPAPGAEGPGLPARSEGACSEGRGGQTLLMALSVQATSLHSLFDKSLKQV